MTSDELIIEVFILYV